MSSHDDEASARRRPITSDAHLGDGEHDSYQELQEAASAGSLRPAAGGECYVTKSFVHTHVVEVHLHLGSDIHIYINVYLYDICTQKQLQAAHPRWRAVRPDRWGVHEQGGGKSTNGTHTPRTMRFSRAAPESQTLRW